MRSLALAAVAVLALTSIPSTSAAQTCSKQFQLVGFSSRAVSGNAGLFEMTRACQESFEASRVCTSEEVMSTVEIPELSAQNAWVRPSFKPIGTGGPASLADASGSASVDAGAEALPGDLSCRGWTRTNDYSGLTVNDDGGFQPQVCGASRPVACCALIRVPEPPLAAVQGGAVAALASLVRAKKPRAEPICESDPAPPAAAPGPDAEAPAPLPS